METHIVNALTPELLQNACSLWSIPVETLALIRAYENFVYETAVDGRRAVMRITYNGHRDRAALEAELDFIQGLAAAHNPVCLPIRSCRGAWVEHIGGPFHASCFVYAIGVKASWRNPEVWHARTFTSWGRTLAALHESAGAAARFGENPRQAWHQDDLMKVDHLRVEDADIAQRLVYQMNDMNHLPKVASCYGLIHADLHQGNFFVSRTGELSIFDFDDACYHWFSYDLAVVMYHLPAGEAELEGRSSRTSVASYILEGYQQLRALPPGFHEQLTRFLLVRDLMMYQAMFKKTAPADRQPWWHVSAAQTAMRIRGGIPVIDITA